MWRYKSFGMALIVAGCLATALGRFVDDPPAAEPQVPKLDPKSSPLRLIYDRFRENGYSAQDAADLADHCLRKVPMSPLPTRVQSDEPALDVSSSPLRIVYDAFLASGYKAEEAMEAAKQCMGLEAETFSCIVYPARMVYCNSEGASRYWDGWIDRNCWDNTLGPCVTQSCLPPNCNWLRVTIQSGCTSLPPNGTCVYLRQYGDPIAISCSNSIVNCTCIVETQCSQIEQTCCACKYCTSVCPICN